MLDQAQQILTQYALDPGMPPNLAAQVARVLSAEGDPSKLDDWASKLDQLNFPKAAQALRAKASALRAVAGAGAALGQIHDVLQGSGATIPTQSPPSAPSMPSPSAMPSIGPIPPAAPTPSFAPAPPFVPAPPFAPTPSFASTTPFAPTPFSPGAAPAPAPSATPGGVDVRALAQAVADDIRAKGCWHENRDLVKQFQHAVYPAAGAVDGFYGPQVALVMAKYISKVPAPCYWPKAPTDRARAKAQWARMVKEANVNVGSQWMGG
jgi:hypothetical protein